MFHIKACFEFMPPTCRLPLCLLFQFTSKLIPGLRSELGFDSIGVHFDTSSGVHLRSSPQSIPDNSKIAFSLSLTTIALYKCRIGWFGSNFWWPKPRGLLSSLVQHERLSSFFMTHWRKQSFLSGCRHRQFGARSRQ